MVLILLALRSNYEFDRLQGSLWGVVHTAVLNSAVLDSEYIPINLRKEIQMPLFKGKTLGRNNSPDRNSYRGITLLTNFSKLFEILLWCRME